MYEHFNPFGLADAWWQQILMLVVASILGFIIGYISKVREIDDLEDELAELDAAVDDCHSRTRKILETPVISEEKSLAVPLAAVVPVTVADLKIDDLKIVEGIGPKIEKLLNEAGINTFDDLANTSPDRIKDILTAAGSRFQMHEPSTWPEQAAYARDERWEELKVWQEQLKGGKTNQ